MGGLALLRIQGAADQLRSAERRVDAAALALEEGRLSDARADLGAARRTLLDATNELYAGLELDLIAWAPVVRENLDSLRESVALASVVVSGGLQVLEAGQPLEGEAGRLEVSLSDGSIPLEAVSATERQVTSLATQLPTGPPAGEPRFLFSATKALRSAVYEEAGRRRAQLDVLSRGLKLLRHLAGGQGPRRYLLAVANTAEMRGAGGMVLSYGVLEGRDGVIDLTAFGRIDELFLDEPVPVDRLDLPADYLARWSGFEPTRLWRNATLSGDFSLVAPVLEAMYEQSTGSPVDGVIQVDPAALAAVLRGVGPVRVGELGVVRAGDVEALVLNEAYHRYPQIEARSDVLGDVAEAAFRRLVDGRFPSLRPLATALAGAVDRRHLLAHSRTGEIESVLGFFGADGSLPQRHTTDYLHLTVQNVSANKLDWYVETELAVTGTRPVGDLGSLQVEIVVRNTAPAGVDVPRYIFGPFNAQQQAGLYRGAVSLYVPTGTTIRSVGGDQRRDEPVVQIEDGRAVVGFSLDVPAGESRRVVLDLGLAPRSSAPYRLIVVPAPRVHPTAVRVDVDTPAGDVAGSVELDTAWAFAPGVEPTRLAGPGGRRW